jgi:hypothetical protein
VQISASGGTAAPDINEQDARSRIIKRDRETDLRRENERRIAAGGTAPYQVDDSWPWELFAFVGGAMVIVAALGAFIAWFIITYLAD